MDNKRLFISLSIEPAISKKIHQRFSQLQLPWQNIKIVPPDQYHLTLKFLGDRPLEQLDKIIDSLTNIKTEQDFVELHITYTAIFNPRNPRVLALVIDNNQALQNLYDQIDQTLYEDGLAHKEVRKFTPHLTIGRIKKSTDTNQLKTFADLKIDYAFSVSSFELQESELSKNGPIYTVLQKFNL